MHTRTIHRAAVAVGAATLLAITGCNETGEPEPESADALNAEQAIHPEPGGESSDADDTPRPVINAPEVEPCPYQDELAAQAPDDPDEFLDEMDSLISEAIDLGCEPDIHGSITFEEPVYVYDDGSTLDELISVRHAMSVDDMCDEGYISEEDCENELP
ncbi:hypothetical protein [Nesterenkonia sp. HG001]|uniref:hypothetical protein n=1 Tax=Nesterenkonia sp. HG001 TaxID=2983207 RepID=UPI002AC3AA28|nr:hypothetical protein [Nesterenkonia sp. HG001]MDZ5077854.1 hypothetical protein [Nesterenkonia sp. HG001]